MALIKTKEQIEKIKQGGKILATIIKEVSSMVKPGVSTKALEERALLMMSEKSARPAFKGYVIHKNLPPYPTALCISINNEVVHGPALPERIIQEGDLVSIDCGIEYPYDEAKGINGYYTDMAVTVAAGKISPEAKKLMKVTERSLELAIEKVKAGNNLSQVGSAVEKYVDENGFSVVRDLVGHGVGTGIHEDPQIPNYATAHGARYILKPGMVIAVEPMVNIGESEIEVDDDGYTFKTADGSLSAHFEHTLIVTEKGCDIATQL